MSWLDMEFVAICVADSFTKKTFWDYPPWATAQRGSVVRRCQVAPQTHPLDNPGATTYYGTQRQPQWIGLMWWMSALRVECHHPCLRISILGIVRIVFLVMMVIAAHLDISSVSEIHMPTNCSKSYCRCSSPKSEERNMVQSYDFIVS